MLGKEHEQLQIVYLNAINLAMRFKKRRSRC